MVPQNRYSKSELEIKGATFFMNVLKHSEEIHFEKLVKKLINNTDKNVSDHFKNLTISQMHQFFLKRNNNFQISEGYISLSKNSASIQANHCNTEVKCDSFTKPILPKSTHKASLTEMSTPLQAQSPAFFKSSESLANKVTNGKLNKSNEIVSTKEKAASCDKCHFFKKAEQLNNVSEGYGTLPVGCAFNHKAKSSLPCQSVLSNVGTVSKIDCYKSTTLLSDKKKTICEDSARTCDNKSDVSKVAKTDFTKSSGVVKKSIKDKTINHFILFLEKKPEIHFERLFNKILTLGDEYITFFKSFTVSKMYKFFKDEKEYFVIYIDGYVSLKMPSKFCQNGADPSKTGIDITHTNLSATKDVKSAKVTLTGIPSIVNPFHATVDNKVCTGVKQSVNAINLKGDSSLPCQSVPSNIETISKTDCYKSTVLLSDNKKTIREDSARTCEKRLETCKVVKTDLTKSSAAVKNSIKEKAINYFILFLEKEPKIHFERLFKKIFTLGDEYITVFNSFTVSEMFKFFKDEKEYFCIQSDGYFSLKMPANYCPNREVSYKTGIDNITHTNLSTSEYVKPVNAALTGIPLKVKLLHSSVDNKVSTGVKESVNAINLKGESSLPCQSVPYNIETITKTDCNKSTWIASDNKKQISTVPAVTCENKLDICMVAKTDLTKSSVVEKQSIKNKAINHFIQVLRKEPKIHFERLFNQILSLGEKYRTFFGSFTVSEMYGFFVDEQEYFCIHSDSYVTLNMETFIQNDVNESTSHSKLALCNGNIETTNVVNNEIHFNGSTDYEEVAAKALVNEKQFKQKIRPNLFEMGKTANIVLNPIIDNQTPNNFFPSARSISNSKVMAENSSLHGQSAQFSTKFVNDDVLNGLAKNTKFPNHKAREKRLISFFKDLIKLMLCESVHYQELIENLQFADSDIKYFFSDSVESEIIDFFKTHPEHFHIDSACFISLIDTTCRQKENQSKVENNSLTQLPKSPATDISYLETPRIDSAKNHFDLEPEHSKAVVKVLNINDQAVQNDNKSKPPTFFSYDDNGSQGLCALVKVLKRYKTLHYTRLFRKLSSEFPLVNKLFLAFSSSDILCFLKMYEDYFNIDSDGEVSLKNPDMYAIHNSTCYMDNSKCSSIDSNSLEIENFDLNTDQQMNEKSLPLYNSCDVHIARNVSAICSNTDFRAQNQSNITTIGAKDNLQKELVKPIKVSSDTKGQKTNVEIPNFRCSLSENLRAEFDGRAPTNSVSFIKPQVLHKSENLSSALNSETCQFPDKFVNFADHLSNGFEESVENGFKSSKSSRPTSEIFPHFDPNENFIPNTGTINHNKKKIKDFVLDSGISANTNKKACLPENKINSAYNAFNLLQIEADNLTEFSTDDNKKSVSKTEKNLKQTLNFQNSEVSDKLKLGLGKPGVSVPNSLQLNEGVNRDECLNNSENVPFQHHNDEKAICDELISCMSRAYSGLSSAKYKQNLENLPKYFESITARSHADRCQSLNAAMSTNKKIQFAVSTYNADMEEKSVLFFCDILIKKDRYMSIHVLETYLSHASSEVQAYITSKYSGDNLKIFFYIHVEHFCIHIDQYVCLRTRTNSEDRFTLPALNLKSRKHDVDKERKAIYFYIVILGTFKEKVLYTVLQSYLLRASAEVQDYLSYRYYQNFDKFFKNYPQVFVVDESGMVSLRPNN